MQFPIKMVGIGLIGLMFVVIFFMTYFTVDQNQMAIVTRFGQFQYAADPGLHFKMPFVNSVTDYRTDIQDLAPTQRVNTYTIDNQEVDVMFTIFYRIPPQKVEYIYANNRDYSERLLSMSIDRLKAAMGQAQRPERRREARRTARCDQGHAHAGCGTARRRDHRLPAHRPAIYR